MRVPANGDLVALLHQHVLNGLPPRLQELDALVEQHYELLGMKLLLVFHVRGQLPAEVEIYVFTQHRPIL